MKQEMRTVLAVVLSVGILIIYSLFFAPKPPPPGLSPATPPSRSETLSTDAKPDTPSRALSSAVQPAPVQAAPPKIIPGRTAATEFAWNSWGGGLVRWQLLAYRAGLEKNSPPIDLVRAPDALRHLTVSVNGPNIAFPTTPAYRVEASDDSHLVLVWHSDSLSLRTIYTWEPDHPIVDIDVEGENRSAQALVPTVALTWEDAPIPAPPSGFLSGLRRPLNVREPVGFWDGKRQGVHKAGESLSYQGKIYWTGIEERYFVAAMMPVDGDASTQLARSADRLSAQVAYPEDTLAPGEKVTHHFRVYLGPKQREELLASGSRLEETVDYGWFGAVAVPILFLLKGFYAVTHNWGLAIIALTVFIKLLLTPITNKSMKSMKAMQALQPELAKLREKYKDKREKLNLEMMQLFKTHKVNPMGGCLPMVLQMPIYIALYKVLYTAIELYHAPFFAFYKDLSSPDPYFVAPVLLGIFMVLQQKFTPATTMDPMQQKMMMLMPVMFSAFMLFLPSGLVIYIFINTFMSVVQQWMMRKDITWRELLTGKWKKA